MSQISRDQFKRLCENLTKDVPALLKARQTDKRMDKQSVLLKELYRRLLTKLGIKGKRVTRTGGFKTFGFTYEVAIYETITQNWKAPFDYAKVVGGFLDRTVRKRR